MIYRKLIVDSHDGDIEMNTVLLVFMLVNGQPTGHTMAFQAIGSNCRNELRIVDGINSAHAQNNSLIRFEASCDTHVTNALNTDVSSFNRSLVD
jgi:hypothetical protein